jgi:hypothetical protein
MNSRLLTIVLVVGLAFSGLLLLPKLAAYRLPGIDRGYEPAQPIAFSHRLHAGEMQIACLYCHSGAEQSRHAGIPAASVCMNCHRFVSASLGAIREEDERAKKEKRPPRRIVSPEIQKLYDALALNDKTQRDPARPLRSIAWTKVYNLPDFVYFDHRAHINAGVACQKCHGPVETMEQMRQVPDLTMGWCVNCHRDVNRNGLAGKKLEASTDCSTCHY